MVAASLSGTRPSSGTRSRDSYCAASFETLVRRRGAGSPTSGLACTQWPGVSSGRHCWGPIYRVSRMLSNVEQASSGGRPPSRAKTKAKKSGSREISLGRRGLNR